MASNKHTYENYLKAKAKLHNDIIEACINYEFGTLCEYRQTPSGNYEIVVIFCKYEKEEFES